MLILEPLNEMQVMDFIIERLCVWAEEEIDGMEPIHDKLSGHQELTTEEKQHLIQQFLHEQTYMIRDACLEEEDDSKLQDIIQHFFNHWGRAVHLLQSTL